MNKVDRYSNKLVYTNEELSQGSDAWKAFREEGIGGSEVSTLMHCNRWSDIQSLWRKRVGLEVQEQTPSMLRGNKLEEEARQKYEKITGTKVEPIVLIHPQYRWIHTSLDGLSDDYSILVEIKCAATKANWKRFTEGDKVPDFRMPQIQQQLAIANTLFGTTTAHYFCYYDAQHCGGSDGKPIEVTLDHSYANEVIRRADIFYREFIHKKKLPPPYLFKGEPIALRAA